MSVLVISTSPAIQRTLVFSDWRNEDVNRAESCYIDASGKGMNAARALTQLGESAFSLSQGGGNANEYADMAKKEGIELELIPNSGLIRMCSTLVVLHDHKGDEAGTPKPPAVSEIVEPVPHIDATALKALSSRGNQIMKRMSGLLLCGSRAPGVPSSWAAELSSEAAKLKLPVLVDLRGEELLEALHENPAIVKINLGEFAKTFLPDRMGFIQASELGGNKEHLDIVLSMLRDLSEDVPTVFIITRGERPVLIGANGHSGAVAVPRLQQNEVVNPIGAGDAMNAALIQWYLKENRSSDIAAWEEGLKFGIRVAQKSTKTLRPAHLS